MKFAHSITFFAAGCLWLLTVPACTSESGDQTVDASVDVSVGIDTSVDTASTTAACPLTAPYGTPSSAVSCSAPRSLVCKYVLIHCPGHPLGEFYEYERAMYQCEDGFWRPKGQDCYDCCRGYPFDGGSDTKVSTDGGTDGVTG